MFDRPARRMGIAATLLIPALLLIGRHTSIAAEPGEGTAPGSERMLAAVAVDKPIYRAGEKVWVRAVVLSATDHRPLPADRKSRAMMRVTGPKGEILSTSHSSIDDSVAAFNWDVPEDGAGGQYTATVSFPWDGFPSAVRKFEVRAYRVPRLKGEIIFLRDGFGAGDTVKASLHVERAEGGLPIGAAITANAIVDGIDVYTGSTKIDAAGNCAVEFKLPSQISKGDGTLSLAIADGGVVEPITKTIPILVKSVDLSLYPEGGELIAGLPCRVYVEARTSARKPADLVGTIIDAKGAVVAEVKTEHEGRGRFTFIPRVGESYAMKLSQPSGIDRLFELPAVKSSGVALRWDRQEITAAQPIELQLTSSDAGSFTVRLSKRKTEAASAQVTLAAGEAKGIVLTPPVWADGVLTATVSDAAGRPIAERLIYRKPTQSLHVSVKADKSSYLPAGAANVTVTTTDEHGKPVSAVVGLTVTDESVLRMIEKRDSAPRLGAMVLLENEVKELADAGVYLDPSDAKAPLALDLLLGTQGWRRFASADEAKFIAEFGDLARRALAERQPIIDEIETRGGVDGRRWGAALPVGAVAVEAPADFNRLAGVQDQKKEAAAGIAHRRFDADKAVNRRRGEERELGSSKEALETPIVRIYAHPPSVDHRAGERSDFTETLYWAAGIKTDEKTGTAAVSFTLNDAVSSFRIIADAFDTSGALGEGTTTITAVRPFYIESKMPLEVSAGDLIRLPVAVVNGTDSPIEQIALGFTAGKGLELSAVPPFMVAANARDRRLVDVKVGSIFGKSDLTVRAGGGALADQVTRQLMVKPLGFPTEIARGGTLDARGVVSHEIDIPQSLVAGSVVTNVALYPTPVGNLTEALGRLLQEPNGCFEQTTSTTYPLIMASQYFLSHTGVDPKLIAQSNELLGKGYDRLRGFECRGKGYEWFGEDPGHECLSAYGMMEFTDMAQVREVDPAMLKNTRTWLLARRDGKGQYSRERRALHSWTADPGSSNGYCTWALLECGEKNLDAEVKWLKERAVSDPNSYVTALAANAMFLAGDREAARGFMEKLAAQQDKDGHVRGATTTVVGSGGESLEIETTSLATLAWLREPAFAAQVERGIHFLADSCKAGRYGSTQATVLALRAILAYDKSRAHPTAAGKAQLMVDGRAMGDALAFDASTQGALKLPNIAELMSPGKHTVELKMTDGSPLPYAVAVSFNSLTPSSSELCKLQMTTELKDATVAEGAVTEARVIVVNRTSETLPTPIAIVGLPGGLEVRHEQLKELVKAERISAYEVRGREVILYWRDLQPNQKVELPLSAVAAIPGSYTGPASRAYLYYTDEYKQWAAGTSITVVAKVTQ